MGNTESGVTSGEKAQAGTSTQKLYKLVDLKGGGLLVDMMKRAIQTKQYAELDHAIKTKVEPFLYNKGKGKLFPISHVVLLRNKERPRHKLLPPLRSLENPDDFDIDDLPIPDESKLEFILNPSKCREVCWDLKERGAVGETVLHLCLLNATSTHAELAKRLLRFYPKLVNDIYMGDQYYGESVLHIAIVNEDPAMVKFLLDSGANVHERCFGTFMSPEDQKAQRSDSLDHEWVNVNSDTNYEGYVYWGEYPLSFAACLGQEECYRLVLAKGANPDSQDTNGNTTLHMLVIHKKMTQFDMAYEVGSSLDIKNNLNLTPLTLAAKLARIEMFFHILNIEREIYWQIGSITCAAYPLSQIDTIDIETGNISKNSALNLVVFGEKDDHLELMDGVLVDLLHAKWNAFVKFKFYRQFFLFCFYFMFSLVCFTLRPGPPPTSLKATASPAINANIPTNATIATNATTTLSPANGTTATLAFLASNGSLPTLNQSLVKSEKRFQRLLPKAAGIVRANRINKVSPMASVVPNTTDPSPLHRLNASRSRQHRGNNYGASAVTIVSHNVSKREIIEGDLNHTRMEEGATFATVTPVTPTTTPQTTTKNSTNSSGGGGSEDKEEETWWEELQGECRLMQFHSLEAKVRLGAELAMLAGSFLYILSALREAHFLGLNMFIENLMTAPSRVMFLCSCLFMLGMPFLRLSCHTEAEDVVAVFIMLTTAPYFLFFCRGFKTVGPFVVMIYRMVMGDLLRFVSIYLVFVMGFSQAYYIIFLSFDNPNTPEGVDDSVTNPMPSPTESIMAMFLMSLTNFGDYFGAFERTDHELEAKLLFVIYMAIVAILLVNMLIAMMGNTYQKIAETRNEWQRQWARIVLVVERGVSPAERLKKLMWYSQPMSDGRRALVLRLHQTEEDKEEMKEILEMKRTHDRMVKKRQRGIHKGLSATPSPKRLVL
ncbi:transient receptor potential cation channel subfamily V member 5 [Schistocerca serialis cubense]|uniref:transient receptor potential cation channel subfamily V member 5 n=1 Tax=Schistocerca serialis cubense TaxID=2023355 RepID=UPI00214E1B7E|nr:transient receptor potential cation channel subfamily V member 5 [Schistocerca serialis cubense]